MKSTRSNSLGAICVAVALLSFFCATLACADGSGLEETDLIGTWSGNSKEEQDHITLTVETGPDGDQLAYDYHNDSQRCGVTGQKRSLQNQTLLLDIIEANGGKCDKLYRGVISLTMSDENQLDSKVTDRDGNLKYEATLSRSH